MLPPRLIRRLVLAPAVIVIALGFIVLSPFLALLALVFGLLGRVRAGHMRSLRLVGFALVWFVAETVALIALAGLWVVSGFGGRLRTEPYQSRHYAIMRRFLDSLYEAAERTYGLRVEVDEPDLTGDELAARLTRPVIVLSRHAGPGDSFLLVHQLLSVYHRRPRVVMKAALQLDPSVDIVGNRLPNVWVKSRQAGEHIFTEQIARLARGLDERGALVIFPEGGNWTPGRWRRGIRRLEHLGRLDLAERARDMPNLLPPRPGGALAAIAACPDADVIFVAHAGLDNIVTVGDVWGKFPIDQVIRARWWRVPSERVPRADDHEAQVQWLYGWWERIDAWITENRPGAVALPAAAPAAGDELREPWGIARIGVFADRRIAAGWRILIAGGESMRIVVTGGAGFVGSHLCDALLARGDSVVCLDNFSTGRPDNVAHLTGRRGFELVKCDVSAGIDVAGPVGAVAHLASAASPPDYQRFPLETLAAGSRGTENALRLAEAKGARFLLASTSEVYGNPAVHPQTEDYWGHVNPIGPRSVYDEAKRFAEALTCAYGRARELGVGVIRIFNTYGPRMSPRDGRVVTNFITQALGGEPVTIYGDGTQTRSFCFVDDLIRGIVAMIDSAERGPVNLGNPEELSVADLAGLVLRITGSSSPVEHRPLPADDPARRCPDIGRARQVLGWQPEVPVAEGIRRTADWLMPYCAPTSGWRADTILPA